MDSAVDKVKDKISEYNGPGIYAIENRRTGKAYVGSTTEIRRRLLVHLNHLRKGDHTTRKLQYAWKASGEDAFEFKILDKVPEAELAVAEQKWMNTYEDAGRLYNAVKTAVRKNSFSEKRKYIRDVRAKLEKEIVVEVSDAEKLAWKAAKIPVKMAFTAVVVLILASVMGLAISWTVAGISSAGMYGYVVVGLCVMAAELARLMDNMNPETKARKKKEALVMERLRPELQALKLR